MGNDRVSKNWQEQGLTQTSTEAILGTLSHYGISTDEKRFKEMAKSQFPMSIASSWFPSWKGTGQFARFPGAAALELWRRWEGERLTPTEYAKSLTELMRALQKLLQGAADAPVGPAFAKMKELQTKVPTKDGHPEESFVDEMFGHLEENAMRFFDELPENLAKEGHIDDAEEFADIESFLIRERQGLSRVMVRAAAGEKDKAITDLVGMTQDSKRAPLARMMCIDALIHLEAYEPAKTAVQALLAEAEKTEEHHLALELVRRLAHIYEVTGDKQGLDALEETANRLEEAHAKAHPEHAHGHHHD